MNLYYTSNLLCEYFLVFITVREPETFNSGACKMSVICLVEHLMLFMNIFFILTFVDNFISLLYYCHIIFPQSITLANSNFYLSDLIIFSYSQPLLHILGVSTAVVCRLDGVVVTPPDFWSHLTSSVVA